MRIELNLEKRRQGKFSIPLNYAHPLAAAIYKLIETASPDFAAWLHKTGYRTQSNRPFKMFVFSKIKTNTIDRESLAKGLLVSSGRISFRFGSAIDQEITKAFIRGALHTGSISIGTKEIPATDFNITDINILPEPELAPVQPYKTLSPLCVSESRQSRIHYLMPDENGVPERIANNLHQKYRLLHSKEYSGPLSIAFPAVQQYKKKSIEIKNNGKIFCFETKLEITAASDMQKVAYDVGVGERNSLGFGMVEPA